MFALQILNLYCTAQTTIEYAQPGEQGSFQKNITPFANNLMFCFTDFESLRDWWSLSEVVFVGQCEALVCLGFA